MGDLTKANKALHYINGTKLEALTQKIAKNNTSGVKGVRKHKIKGKWYWEANIQLSKKRISKVFSSKEEAIKWRYLMEDKIYKPLLDEMKYIVGE